jgi:hypothetical protein
MPETAKKVVDSQGALPFTREGSQVQSLSRPPFNSNDLWIESAMAPSVSKFLERNLRPASYILAGMIACACAVPSLAAPALPTQQSKCEIQANKYKALHPHTDPFHFQKFGIDFFGGTIPPDPPSAYRDPESGITFYVESDGRHLAAIDANGKLLWVRDPFFDSNMCPYRSAHPYIDWIGPPGGSFGRHYLGPFKPTPDAKVNTWIVKEIDNEIMRGRKAEHQKSDDRFIGLSFNSSQFGYVNIRTGDFYDMGQD